MSWKVSTRFFFLILKIEKDWTWYCARQVGSLKIHFLNVANEMQCFTLARLKSFHQLKIYVVMKARAISYFLSPLSLSVSYFSIPADEAMMMILFLSINQLSCKGFYARAKLPSFVSQVTPISFITVINYTPFKIWIFIIMSMGWKPLELLFTIRIWC